MELFKTKLKEKIAEQIATIITVTLSGFIVYIANTLKEYLLKHVDPPIWYWTVVILIIVCMALIVCIFNKREKYIFIADLGIWQEKKSGNYFCTSCRTNGKKSPLKEYDTAWMCMTDFKHKYYKPGKDPKPQERRVINPGIGNGWVNGWRK